MSTGVAQASIVIIAINVVASLLGLYKWPQIVERNLFRPYWFKRQQEYATLITSGFVHADLTHLIFNMMTFWFFGIPLEKTIGTGPFLVLYFTGLLLSHVGTYIKQRNNPDYACLGASGAISAVLFASIVYFPENSIFIFPIPIPIPAPLFAIGYLAYSWWAARNPRGRINHDAHFGGALTGLAFVALTDFAAYRELIGNVFG